MTIENVLAAVAAERSLWVELECPDLPPSFLSHRVTPVTDPSHATLLFLGKGLTPESVTLLVDLVAEMASHDAAAPLVSRVGGVARFRGSAAEGDPVVLLISDLRIRRLHEVLRERLEMPSPTWDYTPHVTLGRVPRSELVAFDLPVLGTVTFPSVAVCAGEARVSMPLGAP